MDAPGARLKLPSVRLPAGLPDELTREWTQAQTHHARAQALLNIAYHVESYSKVQAIESAEAALAYALLTENRRLTIHILLALAYFMGQSNRVAEGLQHIEQALTVARDMGDDGKKLLLDVLQGRATLRHSYGDERGARQDYEFILKQPAQEVSEVTLLLAQINLSLLFVDLEQHELALHQLRLAAEHLQSVIQHGETSGQPFAHADHYHRAILEARTSALLAQAEQLRERGRTSSMLEILPEAEQLTLQVQAMTQAEETESLLALEVNLSTLRRLQGNLDAAGTHAHTSLHLQKQLGPNSNWSPFKALADWHQERGEWPAAISLLQEALNITQNAGDSRASQRILGQLADLHERLEDWPAALRLTREALRQARNVMSGLDQWYALGGLTDASEQEQPFLEQNTALSWQERLHMAEQQAQRDPLTGLLNRRGLEAALKQAAVQQTAPQPDAHGAFMLVALLDIDHFKSVNDDYSHTVGDHVLKQVAALLKANLPAQALLARYGGEEFLLVTPTPSPQAAHELLESCRQSIAQHDWSDLLGQRPLTISAGYTVQDLDPFHMAVENADEELYAAKQSGRNCVHPQVTKSVTG